MSFPGGRGGNNPRYGRDSGNGPPSNYPQGTLAPGGVAPMAMPMPTTLPMSMLGVPSNPYVWPGLLGGAASLSPNHPIVGAAWAATTNADGKPSWYAYASGFQGGGRQPQPHPVINPHLPAANLTNSTGGLGCEPGYNYFFPTEHTKVHVLKSGAVPPWQLPPNFTMPFHACHVPVHTTVEELMRGFGATNPTAKRNKIYEVCQGGNGRWYRGLSFRGDMRDAMKKPIKELGWDKTRNGLPGGKPVVYLYLTKD